jgi:hypothetical protein
MKKQKYKEIVFDIRFSGVLKDFIGKTQISDELFNLAIKDETAKKLLCDFLASDIAYSLYCADWGKGLKP